MRLRKENPPDDFLNNDDGSNKVSADTLKDFVNSSSFGQQQVNSLITVSTMPRPFRRKTLIRLGGGLWGLFGND